MEEQKKEDVLEEQLEKVTGGFPTVKEHEYDEETKIVSSTPK